MEPDVSATLKTRIKELLLMTKSEIPANILAVLGLHPADFIDPYIRWSAEEVVVLSKLLPQERGEKMVLHPCLLDVDLDATADLRGVLAEGRREVGLPERQAEKGRCDPRAVDDRVEHLPEA